MISFDAKPEATTSSPSLKVVSKDDEKTISFSELLKGIGTKKDEKLVQNGAMVLSLADDKDAKKTPSGIKNDMLVSLLKGDALVEEENLPLELNPKLTSVMTQEELKTLIKDAKDYLKSKIINSEDFKRAEIKDLPKTLKGLAQAAKKIGIDISKITIEEVNVKETALSDIKGKKEFLNKNDLKEDPFVKKISKPDKSTQITISQQLKVDNQIKDIKSTSLFKAQTKNFDITTEQFVNSKIVNFDKKIPKQKTDDTLQLLLRGKKTIKQDSSLTADFSVATAKVIAPSAKTDISTNLESLLKGETNESVNSSKVDGLNVVKSDSFEVKLNEAKQMIKYLSQDVKNAMDDYKSPFTRVKVQLNPQKLGEIDLTIVQRGKNLHINISSNNSAINALSMNANELRVQLNNNGINNATLNFSNNPQGENSSNAQQQEQRGNEQKAHNEYGYFENEESNEEILSSLEIVVPHYV
jgi:flagellar hook-length control protein FliK